MMLGSFQNYYIICIIYKLYTYFLVQHTYFTNNKCYVRVNNISIYTHILYIIIYLHIYTEQYIPVVFTVYF